MSKVPRIMALISHFPRPDKNSGLIWALSHHQAYLRQGTEIVVVCPVNRTMRVLSRFPRFRVHNETPFEHDWDGLRVLYPTWLHPFSVRFPRAATAIGYYTARRALDAIIEEFRPDLIHAHSSVPSGLIAARLKRRHGVPYALTDHSAWMADKASEDADWKSAYEEAHGQASVSVMTAPYMRKRLERFSDPARIVDLPPGSDPIPQSIRDAPRPAERSAEFSIFSCGVLYERKGHQVLIQAFRELLKSRPNARLRIAGSGPWAEHLRKLVRDLNLEDRVFLLGMCSHSQVLQEMAWCDVFALTSWSEPFGVVYAEAMSAGKPVVWTSDCGIDDFLTDGIHGFRVEPRNVPDSARALQELASSPELCARMGEGNREYFTQNFTWDRIAAKLLETFKAKIL